MTNALCNDNRLKLGVFGLNVSNGCAATTAEGHLQPTWQNNLDIAVMADRAGIEALVPVARWKGFGGKTNFNGTCFETYTWAAGMVFISIAEDADDETTARISAQRAVGREEFGREFQVWTACSVVCRPTEKEAVDYAATISSTKATGTRSPTWRVVDAGPDRRALASGCAVQAGVVTC